MRTPHVATTTTITTWVAALASVLLAPPSAGGQVGAADSGRHIVVPLRRGGTVVERVLGDPKVAGAPYVLRIHNEANFFVFPHTHPEDEHVVVLEGTWHLGAGGRFDRAKLRPLRPGDFVLVPKRMAHFAWSDGPTVIQVHGTGPFRVDFVDPAFALAEAGTDSGAARHFKFRRGDAVAFDGGRGVVRDGLASPANRIVQYLVETPDGRQIVLEERTLRRGAQDGPRR